MAIPSNSENTTKLLILTGSKFGGGEWAKHSEKHPKVDYILA